MASIFEIFDAKEIAAYYDAMVVAQPTDSVVLQKFPNTRTSGLKLSWIKGYNQVPVALQPSAFDAKAQVRDRIGIAKLETEMPLFRESMRIGEKERQDIGTLLNSSVDLARPIITKIYDDVKNLVDGANVQARRMACSVMATGAISIAVNVESGRTTAYDYQYDPDGSWASKNTKTLAAGAKWTEANKANSNPIKDLMEAKSIMRKKGVIVSEAIMNAETYEGMIASESIVKAINPLGATSMIITDVEAQNYVEQRTGIKIRIEDGVFVDENKKEKYFLETGYVCLCPANGIGNTHFGTTPEEYDLRTGNTGGVSVSVVGGGIAITTIKEPHPVNILTVVSGIVLPSFEGMNRVYSLRV